MRKGWKSFVLGDIVELKQGFALNKKTRHYINEDGSGLPLLKISDLSNGVESLFVNESIPPQFIVEPHEIIFSRTGQVGLVFTGRRGVVYNNCFKVIPSDVVDPHFLYLWLSNGQNRDYIRSLATGAAQPDLNHGAFKSVAINLPPLPTQKKIASILSAYDDLIENNLRRIKLLEEMAQQTYEEWFVRMKFPGHETAEWDEETGLPVGWERKKLGEVVTTSSGGTPSRKKIAEYYENGTIPFVKTKELKEFMIIDAEQRITEDGLQHSSAKMFPKGTVLLAMYGNTIGETTYMTFDGATNQACCAFLCGDNTGLSLYLHQFFLRNKELVLSYRMGAAQENISQTIIKDIQIDLPTDEALTAFRDLVGKVYTIIESILTQNQHLKEARDLLLPRLMMGLIDVEEVEVDNEELIMKNHDLVAGSGEVSVAAESGVSYDNQAKSANTEFKDAILFSVIIDRYATNQIPVSRFRYNKLSYLYRRYMKAGVQQYKRKAAGPYNHQGRYRGGEGIMLRNKYVALASGSQTKFRSGEQTAKAKSYFEQYWDSGALQWLDQFRYAKNNKLELFATVDHCMMELRDRDTIFSVVAVKQIIDKESEWKDKLAKECFSDDSIREAIATLQTLFKY